MNRRKFRSQTSDLLNDEGRSVQPVRRERERRERERVRREKSRRERESKKKEDQKRERESEKKEDRRGWTGRKVAKRCVFFRCFVAPGGGKVGSLKRQVRSHVARWVVKKCQNISYFNGLDVKSVKNHQGRTTFGSWSPPKVSKRLVF